MPAARRPTGLPTTINAFTGQHVPAYLQPGMNPITGNLNSPIEQAQHNFAGPGPAALAAALRKQGLSFGSLAPSGGGGRGRPGPSLAASGLDPESARSIAVNDYLADLTGERAAAFEADQAAGAAASDRSAVQRAAAIANDPTVSAYGRPIVGKDGSYATGDPSGQPSPNRQAIAAQMAPGLIAPPAPEKVAPVTFGAPEPAMVNGKRVFVRPGSDGRMYDTSRRPIDAAALQPIEQGGGGALETIIGPDGKAIRVERKDAIGKEPAAGTMKASTGQQKRVLNFFNRAQQADTDLEGLEEAIQGMGLAEQGRLAFAPNFLQSQEGQSYTAAQRAFTEARLRKDSGAAIPDQEFANDRKTYFAQPGDSKATLEQKRRARGAMLASLAFESGQALGEFVGDEAEAKAITQRYKDRAAGTVEMLAPDGSILDVPSSDVEKLLKAGAKRKGG